MAVPTSSDRKPLLALAAALTLSAGGISEQFYARCRGVVRLRFERCRFGSNESSPAAVS
jgi:hypothetical protein